MGLFGRKKKKDLVYEGATGTATIRTATRDERLHTVDGPDDPVLGDLGIGTLKYRLELDWDAWRASPEQQELRDGFDDEERAQVHDGFPDASRTAMVDGWVKAYEVGNLSREKFDEAIRGAVSTGMLDEREAQAATARVEQIRPS